MAAALKSIVRAYQIATTLPKGPTYVCLDAALQEARLDNVPPPPPLKRFAAADPPEPSAAALTAATTALTAATRPLVMIGRVSNSRDDWDRRVALVERIGARVLTDLKNGACFPTQHKAHPFAPGLFVGADAGGAMIREADVILALDWIDLGGTFRQACGGEWPTATVINCSLDQYVHNGWSMDYQALPAVDIPMLAAPDTLVATCCAPSAAINRKRNGPRSPPPPAPAETPSDGISIDELARATMRALDGLDHPSSACRSAGPAGSAASPIRSTTSASTAAAALVPDPAWPSARRSRCAAPAACPWRSSATATT